jgi:hypothetical protein
VNKRKKSTKTPPKTPTTWREWRTMGPNGEIDSIVFYTERNARRIGTPVLVECRVVQPRARKRGGKCS